VPRFDYLSTGPKRNALAYLNKVAADYEKQAAETQEHAVYLFDLRKATSAKSISDIENYVNRLAHTPKQYIKIVSEYRIEVDRFDHVIAQLHAEAGRVPVQSGSMAGAAVGAGAAFAAFAPTAALAVATTFGTASTGAAISALSGAAATSAAMAWLGGGALAAGGGGIAAGEGLLVLAGPVGWAIGGAALLATGLWMRGKNARIAIEAQQQGEKIEGRNKALLAAQTEIRELMAATKNHAVGLQKQLAWLTENAPNDFQSFDDEQKLHLAALVNNVESLSALLNKTVT
jgi:hypothetical protein